MSHRVLHLAACPYPTAGGTQVFIRQLVTHLARAGHDVHLLTYGFGDTPDLTAFDRAEPYRLHRAHPVPGHHRLAAGPAWGRLAADALLLAKGLHVLHRHGPFDLVHAHNYEGAIAGILLTRATGLPLLYHAHNLMADELPTYAAHPLPRALTAAFGRTLDALVPPAADRVVAVSRHAADRLAALTRAPVHFIPPAIDPAPADTDLPPLPPADCVYCGNLDGYQDPDVMFDALARLGRTRPVRFTLVTNDDPARWRPLADRLPPAVTLHHLPHTHFHAAAAALAAARVALLPRTVPSGFPIKLLNHLAAACPTVAARGSAQGLTEADGVVVVPDRDPDAMALAIEAVLTDPARRDRLARAARAAADRFRWPAHLDALTAIYDAMTLRGSPEAVVARLTPRERPRPLVNEG